MSSSDAIFVNCNDPQLPALEIMLLSLRDPHKGNFQGDVWVLSTNLSKMAKDFLTLRNVQYFEDSLDYVNDWHGRDKAALFTLIEERNRQNVKIKGILSRPDVLCDGLKGAKENEISVLSELYMSGLDRALELERDKAFEIYKNKRMSKLIFLEFCKAHPGRYEKVIFCDTDVLFQGDVNKVFKGIKDSSVYFNYESMPTSMGSTPFAKNIAYINYVSSDVKLLAREINIGVLSGSQESMERVWTQVRDLMFDPALGPLIEYNWHEQDYFRLLLSENPEWFTQLDESVALNLFNGWSDYMEMVKPLKWRTKGGVTPAILHFLGGCWGESRVLSSYYKMDASLLMLSEKLTRLDDKQVMAKKADPYNTISWKEVLPLLGYTEEARMNITEIGTFLGGGIRALRDELHAVRMDVYDSSILGHEWFNALLGKGLVGLYFQKYWGRSQLEMQKYFFNGADNINFNSASIFSSQEIDLAILNRVAHKGLFAGDFSNCWRNLKPSGCIGINNWNDFSIKIRTEVYEVLLGYVSEISEILYLSTSGKLVICRK